MVRPFHSSSSYKPSLPGLTFICDGLFEILRVSYLWVALNVAPCNNSGRSSNIHLLVGQDLVEALAYTNFKQPGEAFPLCRVTVWCSMLTTWKHHIASRSWPPDQMWKSLNPRATPPSSSSRRATPRGLPNCSPSPRLPPCCQMFWQTDDQVNALSAAKTEMEQETDQKLGQSRQDP